MAVNRCLCLLHLKWAAGDTDRKPGFLLPPLPWSCARDGGLTNPTVSRGDEGQDTHAGLAAVPSPCQSPYLSCFNTYLPIHGLPVRSVLACSHRITRPSTTTGTGTSGHTHVCRLSLFPPQLWQGPPPRPSQGLPNVRLPPIAPPHVVMEMSTTPHQNPAARCK